MELNYDYFSSELPFDFSYKVDPTRRNDSNGNSISKQVEEDITIEFDEKNQKADKIDYLIAAGSGMLSSALSFLWNKDISLPEASNWGHERTEEFVKKVAKKCGFKSKESLKNIDIKDAIRFLEEKYPLSGDELTDQFGGGLQHHLRDFTHHPSIIGLIFSILSQFTLRGYGTDTDGRFISPELPYKKNVGKDIPEKIIMGTFMWVMHLISDMAGSSKGLSSGTGIPGPLLSLLKEISALPFIHSVKVKYKDKTDREMDITFSAMLSKFFNGTHTYLNHEGESIRFDLRTEMGIAHHIAKGALVVIANETLTRGLFSIKKLYEEINKNNLKSYKDLGKINVDQVLPTNDKRELIRMLAVSSAAFVAITTGVTAIKSAKKSKGNKTVFVTDMLLNLNYAGIGRFVFAVRADSKYLVDDIVQVKNRYLERQFLIYQTVDIKMLDCFELDKDGTNVLQLLKKQYINLDIELTHNKKKRKLKEEWLEEFTRREKYGIDFSSNENVYRCVNNYYNEHPDRYGIILLELVAFDPYYPYEPKDLEKYKSIGFSKKKVSDRFLRECTAVTKAEYRELEKAYLRALSELKESTKKKTTIAIATILLTVMTGGAAWYFAPEIAVFLAGGAFAGLHGAALTSASLAMIGGGALAVGGLGMAGGTAIITGGGALICAAGLSASLSLALAMSTSKVFTLKECAKIIVLCRRIFDKNKDNTRVVDEIKKSLLRNISIVMSSIEEIKEDKKIDDKKRKSLIRNSVDSSNYLLRCYKLLSK